jgi:four helix bundle protein
MELEVLDFELNEEKKTFNIRHRCFLSKEIILFVRNSKYDRIYHSLYEQLLRSATSIGANVVEGRAGSTKKDWRNFYMMALKSANETKYWLCLIRDTIENDKRKINELINEADELSKIIASIVINSET